MPPASLSCESACSAVSRILGEFESPAIAAELRQALKESRRDVNEIMARVVPLIFEIQGHVMEEYGFQGDDEGFAAFAEALKANEIHEQFNALAKKLKEKMKQLTTPVDEDDDDEDEDEEDEDDDDDDDADECADPAAAGDEAAIPQ